MSGLNRIGSVLALLTISACAQPRPAPPPQLEWIVDLSAASAEVSPQGQTGTIVFKGPSLPFAFTDEPARDDYTPPAIESLLLIWDRENPVPPNAVLQAGPGKSPLAFDILKKPELLANGDLKMDVRFFKEQGSVGWTVSNPSLVIDDWFECLSMMYHCNAGGVFMVATLVLDILNSVSPEELQKTLVAKGLGRLDGLEAEESKTCVYYAEKCVFYESVLTDVVFGRLPPGI